jgi:UDP-2,4-diacetamido-2,4,6-trideoxy-beta-L-altropyranose hydrolase
MIPAKATAKPLRVLFLADCGPEVGGGHVMRCLSLATALTARGAMCGFVEFPETRDVLASFAGDDVARLAAGEGPLPARVRQVASLAGDWGANVVVVDHYGVSADQERILADDGRAIILIDDLADRAHQCGLLIDPGFGRSAEDYRSLVPSGARILAGPAYALLRPEYAAARPAATSRRGVQETPKRLLVALGLTDFRGITGRVLNIVLPALEGIHVDVVTGAGAPSLTWLEHLAGSDPRVRLHVQTRGMVELMAAADVAIGAGGSSTWERACLGLPSISLILADNQRGLAQALGQADATLAVDAAAEGLPTRLLEAFVRLRDDGALRSRLSEAAAGLCDGLGAQRAADAILEFVR